MRYLLIVMLIAGVFFLRPGMAASCSFGLTNCTGSDTFDWCSYDDDGVWYTMYDYDSNVDQSANTTDCVGLGCNPVSDDQCYVIVQTNDVDVFDCTSYDYDGFVGCSEYACVDDTNGWQTSSSEFCCSDNTCTTDGCSSTCDF